MKSWFDVSTTQTPIFELFVSAGVLLDGTFSVWVQKDTILFLTQKWCKNWNWWAWVVDEKVKHGQVFHFLTSRNNSSHQTLLFQTVTFTENGSFLHKKLTIVTFMHYIVHSFVR